MSLAAVLPFRSRRRPATRGEDPYANTVPAGHAVAGLAPEPTFTPRDPARPTGQQPVLPADGPVLVASTSPAAMRQAAKSLRRGIAWDALEAARRQEGLTYAQALAARTAAPCPLSPEWQPPARPEMSRAEAFAEDMRHTTGLPLFRRTAHAGGWRGVDQGAPEGRVVWTVARWHAAAADITARQVAAARARLHDEWEIAASRARVFAPQQQGGAR